ncbi:MAG: alanyl-tRNA editing protein [Lachnospiraceae bacterium]|nr:alanyl-tRNA editing protein [Lachnospiraceae bacterium]
MEKLFYKDTHILDFEATVTECTADKKGFRVVLDQTAFFPEEGGQLADAGTLKNLPVLDVQIKEDVIYHYMEQPFEVGEKVTGHVDWDRRFDFMQQHSGEHILSGLIHKHYGFNNVGFHLGLTEVTMDFDGVLTPEQARILEQEANQIVWKNLPIHTSFPSKEALSTLEYRSKIEIEGAVRIVEIPGVDVCACCAPHVEMTGEIGMIKVVSAQNHRGGVRLSILCGERARKDYTARQDAVTAISVLLSAKPDLVAEAVEKLQSDSLQLKVTANQLANQLMQQQIASLPSAEACSHPLLFVELSNTVAIRNTVNELTVKYPGYCAIFTSNDESGYSFIIGSSTKDCRELAASLRTSLGAKGGGTAPMIQGSVNVSKAQLEAFWSSLD